MTNSQLNRAVKKLAKNITEQKIDPNSSEGAAEFDRLYRADRTLKSFNAHSLRILIALNRKYEYLPVHRFGMYVEL